MYDRSTVKVGGPEQIQLKSRPHVAVFVGRYQGRRYYRYPVECMLNNSRTLQSTLFLVWVLAPSGSDAIEWVRENEAFGNRPETKFTARGPKGGTTYRYNGFENTIARAIFA